MPCDLCVGGLPPNQLFFFLLPPGFRKQASWEAHSSLAANRRRTRYTLWHKWLNESAHLLKGVFPPWCLGTISPYFVLNPNDWRRCAFIMDYWGLNLIELKRSPVNHISCHFSLQQGDKSPRWLWLDKTPRWVFQQAAISHQWKNGVMRIRAVYL